MNRLKRDLARTFIVPAIPRMCAVGIPVPVLVTTGNRIPNLNLVGIRERSSADCFRPVNIIKVIELESDRIRIIEEIVVSTSDCYGVCRRTFYCTTERRRTAFRVGVREEPNGRSGLKPVGVNGLERNLTCSLIVPTIPFMSVIGIPVPVFVTAGDRIPNLDLIRSSKRAAAVEILRGDRVKLEALTVNRRKRNAERVEVALCDVLVDIPDIKY